MWPIKGFTTRVNVRGTEDEGWLESEGDGSGRVQKRPAMDTENDGERTGPRGTRQTRLSDAALRERLSRRALTSGTLLLCAEIDLASDGEPASDAGDEALLLVDPTFLPRARPCRPISSSEPKHGRTRGSKVVKSPDPEETVREREGGLRRVSADRVLEREERVPFEVRRRRQGLRMRWGLRR